MKHICKVYCKNLCWRQLCIKTWPVFVGVEKREVATKLGLKKWSILIASTPEVGDLYGQGHSVCLWVFCRHLLLLGISSLLPLTTCITSYTASCGLLKCLWQLPTSLTRAVKKDRKNFFNTSSKYQNII